VAHSLRTSTTDVAFRVVVEWKRGDHTARTCSATIDGTTKSGTRALVARTFEVAILPLPGAPEADVDTTCTETLRADLSAAQGGVSQLSTRLVASYAGRSVDVAAGTVEVDFTDASAVRARFAAIDAAAAAEEKKLAAQRRMPTSLMPTLDGLALISVRETIQDRKLTEFTPLRVVLVERDFTIERDDKTSVVLRRYIPGVVAFRRPDGTCFMEPADFEQEFDGVHYGRLAADFDAVPKGGTLACANVGP
jgi:hypothetical protein